MPFSLVGVSHEAGRSKIFDLAASRRPPLGLHSIRIFASRSNRPLRPAPGQPFPRSGHAKRSEKRSFGGRPRRSGHLLRGVPLLRPGRVEPYVAPRQESNPGSPFSARAPRRGGPAAGQALGGPARRPENQRGGARTVSIRAPPTGVERRPLGADDLHAGEVATSTTQHEPSPVQQLVDRRNRVRIGDPLVVDVGAAFADRAAAG